MPDLTNSPLGGDSSGTLGANYKKAQLPFSRLGTRRLQFYVIEIAGYDAYDGSADDDNSDFTWEEWYDRWYTYPGNGVATAVVQGIQTVAEIYALYDWEVEYDETDSDYPYTYFTVAVANSTFVAGDNMNFSSHSISLQDAIDNCLQGVDFSYEYVDAWPAEIVGGVLEQVGDPNSVAKPGRPQQTAEQKAVGNARRAARAAARAAAGKPALRKSK